MRTPYIAWKKIFVIAYSIVLSALAGYWTVTNMLHVPIEIPKCTFRRVTGLYCPGCGMTRSVKTLLRGDILLSVYYAPHIIYICFIATWAFISFLIEEKIRKKEKRKIQKMLFCMKDRYVWIGLILFLGNWFIRNILLLIFQVPTL